ncbi:MAG: hypothetical protein U0S36_01930 [Candidatus Nanopelagicales bacterium]
MSEPLAAPDRAQIDAVWSRVADGTLSREEAHAWAEPFVLADTPSEDVMVMSGLQSIHGLDMTERSEDGTLIGHGPPGPYVRTLEEVRDVLDNWRARCLEWDADPVAAQARNTARTREYLQQHGIEPRDSEQADRWRDSGLT